MSNFTAGSHALFHQECGHTRMPRKNNGGKIPVSVLARLEQVKGFCIPWFSLVHFSFRCATLETRRAWAEFTFAKISGIVTKDREEKFHNQFRDTFWLQFSLLKWPTVHKWSIPVRWSCRAILISEGEFARVLQELKIMRECAAMAHPSHVILNLSRACLQAKLTYINSTTMSSHDIVKRQRDAGSP